MKYVDKYNKKHYIQVCFRLKPEEKKKLDLVINKNKISIREFILKHLEKEV